MRELRMKGGSDEGEELHSTQDMLRFAIPALGIFIAGPLLSVIDTGGIMSMLTCGGCDIFFSFYQQDSSG